MNKLKRNKGTLLLSLALSAGLLLPVGVNAQNGGGVFARGDNADNTDNSIMMSQSNRGSGMDWSGGGMTPTDPTTGETPLGGGLLLLVAAGAGYAIVKSKNGKEEQK